VDGGWTCDWDGGVWGKDLGLGKNEDGRALYATLGQLHLGWVALIFGGLMG
jgi:hypothetical protein